MVIHVVRPGDSLYRIAQQHGVPLAYLIAVNELQSPNKLTPGQTIVVPVPAETYVVRRGDTLGRIASANDTTVNRLWQLNPQLGGTDRIYPGQTLTLRLTQQPLGRMAVNGYAYPNIDLRTLRKTLPYLTYLSVFSYGFSQDGRIRPQDTTLLTRMARQYGVRPLLVLTTLDENGRFSGERADQLLRSPAARQTLLSSLGQTLEGGGFDGVDVDFEYIPPEDDALYASFLQDLTRVLSPQGYSVSVALAPKTSGTQRGLLYEAHDYGALGAAADFALLMTFEWGYALSEPMAVAPIDKVEQVVAYAVSVIPPEKILMGIPNYGYDWTLPFVRGESRAQSLGNVQATEQAVAVGAPIAYNEQAQTPYYTYWRERAAHEVWFEDARSIRAKLALVGEYGLRGVSIWNLMRFFPQLWLVLSGFYEIEKQ